jgi:hypothetical protein
MPLLPSRRWRLQPPLRLIFMRHVATDSVAR